ncbi:MAG TPA: aminoglycoside 6-adenylyltransferase [Opitutaceae bacterium]
MATAFPALDLFLARTLEVLKTDERIEAVLVAGSAIQRTTDRFSDLDLVIVCRESAYAGLLEERRVIASSLGPLLAAFTGEHVGEPRLLICLFDAPLLHVDLKFVTREALDQRVETPRIAFDRGGHMPAMLAAGTAVWPARAPEWFEERFWIWMHYGAAKIARGELFEAHDLLAFVRSQVLGPMLARNGGRRQRGVRQVEFEVPRHVEELAATIPRYDPADCWRALRATIDLYRHYRRPFPPTNHRERTEQAVTAFIAMHGG